MKILAGVFIFIISVGLSLRKSEQELRGSHFTTSSVRLLHATPVASVEDAAKVAGIDLTKKDFWEKSLLSYEKNVDEFERLVNKLYK